MSKFHFLIESQDLYMKILAIETSCDETSLSIIEAKGGIKNPSFKVVSHALASQVEMHAQYGGVYPSMAKREHSKNIWPLFEKTLKDAKILKNPPAGGKNEKPARPAGGLSIKDEEYLKENLTREPEVLEYILEKFPNIQKPKIDLIVVTKGPGLEPALWVGITFAKVIAKLWDVPIIGADHMKGHAVSVLLQKEKAKINFPALALLVSGGHTEIVLVKNWNTYKKVGETKDDAVGEAFDKVARMLGLPYPGGPQISRLAKNFKGEKKIKLPRPMIGTNDFDFSFSGLKTAVLYLIRDLTKEKKMNEKMKEEIAHEFQEACVDVLDKKLFKALKKYKAKSIIVGGGVSANIVLKERLTKSAKEINIPIIFPQKDLSTDNSIMIGMAGYFKYLKKNKGDNPKSIIATGGLEI